MNTLLLNVEYALRVRIVVRLNPTTAAAATRFYVADTAVHARSLSNDRFFYYYYYFPYKATILVVRACMYTHTHTHMTYLAMPVHGVYRYYVCTRRTKRTVRSLRPGEIV